MIFLSTLPVPHAVSTIACSSKQTITSSRSRQQGILCISWLKTSSRPASFPRCSRRSLSSRMTRRQPRVRLEHVQHGQGSRDGVLVTEHRQELPRRPPPIDNHWRVLHNACGWAVVSMSYLRDRGTQVRPISIVFIVPSLCHDRLLM